MKISKLASTIFLATSICTIFLFALIFYILLNADPKTTTVLKESLTLTSSFFGGISTLVAAFIATQLFNDWKEEKIFLILKDNVDLANKIIDEMQDDLDVFSKTNFNNPVTMKKLLYQLYEAVYIIKLNKGDIEKYKELHIKVASILADISQNDNSPLKKEDRITILIYRGEISKMKTTLTNHLDKQLNRL
ncbi:hypothetical protein D3C78_97140 [compost metagenome]